jgi:choice-of-anchor B domain-containing protein
MTRLGLLAVLLAAPVSAQSVAGGRTDNGLLASFGASVAIAESDVLVGEPNNSMRPGTVYIYRKSGTTWREALTVTSVDGAPGDGFGAAMSVAGQALLVGATRQNEGRGAVYAFQREGNRWRQTAKFSAVDLNPNDGFGAGVLLLNDIALVSAPNQTRGTGAVYVFRRNGVDWVQTDKLVSSEAKEQIRFGAGIAAAGDAIFVGEPGFNERTGIVRVFKADASGSWKETGRLATASLQRGDFFGATLSAQDDLLLIGASGTNGGSGLVYSFRKTPEGEWREHHRLAPFDAARFDGFGASSVVLDGGQAWIGATQTNGNRGTVYHYWRAPNDSVWTGVERFRPANLDVGDRFGSTVASRGDLAAIALVADDYGSGTVVIMERIKGVWKQQAMVQSPPERIASVTGKKTECSDGKAAGFECRDYDLMSFLSISDIGGARGVRLSGNWGWSDPETGREYALIGRVDGTSFVDVTNPEKPVYVGDLPKTAEANPSSWREIKTYKNWALIVSDGSGPHGIQFFDLTRLRNVKKTPAKFEADYTYRRLASIHNIVVNEEAGVAAAVGAGGGGETCGGGLHMIDIKDPRNPQFLGCFADTQTGRARTGYSHDALCLNYRGPDKDYAGREICLGSNETMLSIADVTDKKAPKSIARASYPNVGYSHQGWYDAEQRYFYMNDELDEVQGLVNRTRTIIWDLADLDDPQVVGEFFGTTQASDHNLYVIGDLMYQSNYYAGLRVIDITDRKNPVEVGFFDTVPYGTNGPGFGGSWNNYPFFKSGNIVVSSGSEGVFVVRKKGPKVVS